ncbi:MAG: rod-binding protein [Boseongicola sp.]
MPDISIFPGVEQPDHRIRNPALWEQSKALEASFLSEMLKASGLGKSREEFGGGVGEDQFSGLLASEQAKAMVEAGGIGLAESIYRSLAEKEHEQ